MDFGLKVSTHAIAWRGLILLTLCVIVFGASLRPLGFLPALSISIFLSTLASIRFRPVPSLVVTGAMAVFCWLVFVKGLRLPLPLLGPWLGGY
jgi:putative tricarboxylic transport membrane protein